jgi:bifunctional non-homologous end joining protein LigD
LPTVPDVVHQLKIEKGEGREGIPLWIDSVDGLIGLVAMGTVEIHPWNATVSDLEHPDRIVIDLDPGEGVEWAFVTDTALTMREMLKTEGLDSWPKRTGGKGILSWLLSRRPSRTLKRVNSQGHLRSVSQQPIAAT